MTGGVWEKGLISKDDDMLVEEGKGKQLDVVLSRGSRFALEEGVNRATWMWALKNTLMIGPGAVAHACNSSTLGGRDRRIA